MIKTQTLIIGGGASGLVCAVMLKSNDVIVLERGERVGRKLSATGNGQGNVTNIDACKDRYFTVGGDDCDKIGKALGDRPSEDMIEFLESIGGCFLPDSRGRVYPASKQASAVTDLLRYKLSAQGKKVVLGSFVRSVKKVDGKYEVTATGENGSQTYLAINVVVCCGGAVAKNFGTDGNGYNLVAPLGHTKTELFPSLVQLKTDTTDIKTLKGIRVFAKLEAYVGKQRIASETGDVIFADYGISGDAAFRISAFVTDKISKGVCVSLDLLPDVSEQKLIELIKNKQKLSGFPQGESLCGILNNQVGRAVLKRARSNDAEDIARTVKNFTLSVNGSLGNDYAQVTKGGIRLSEVTESLESKKNKNLYFAGEILDVDGRCGGFNLQWAYSSAKAVANSINGK